VLFSGDRMTPKPMMAGLLATSGGTITEATSGA